jgi:hypothetical protein
VTALCCPQDHVERDLGVEVRFGSAVGTGGAALNIITGGGDRRCPEVLRSRPSDPTEVLLPAGSGRWMCARQGRPDYGWTPPRLVAAIRTARWVCPTSP